MSYDEFKRKKEQIEKRKENLKKQMDIANKSLQKLKMDRLVLPETKSTQLSVS